VKKLVWRNFCKKNRGGKILKFPHCTAHCGNARNLPSLGKILVKSIYSTYNSLVKKLLWRNFCKKIVGEKLSNFHTVYCAQYEKTKIFRQINYLADSLVKLLLSRNFCQKWMDESKFPSFENYGYMYMYTLWKNQKFTLTEFFFSSNQLFSNFFSEYVSFTKFLPKYSESISTLHSAHCGNTEKHSHQIFRDNFFFVKLPHKMIL